MVSLCTFNGVAHLFEVDYPAGAMRAYLKCSRFSSSVLTILSGLSRNEGVKSLKKGMVSFADILLPVRAAFNLYQCLNTEQSKSRLIPALSFFRRTLLIASICIKILFKSAPWPLLLASKILLMGVQALKVQRIKNMSELMRMGAFFILNVIGIVSLFYSKKYHEVKIAVHLLLIVDDLFKFKNFILPKINP